MRRHLSDSMDEMKARTSGDTGSSQAQGATSTKTSEEGMGLTWSRRKGQTRGSGPKEQGQHTIQEDQKSQWSLALRTWQGPLWLKEAFERHPPPHSILKCMKMYSLVSSNLPSFPFLCFSTFVPFLFPDFFFSFLCQQRLGHVPYLRLIQPLARGGSHTFPWVRGKTETQKDEITFSRPCEYLVGEPKPDLFPVYFLLLYHIRRMQIKSRS